jgi:hypothetical protein
VLSFLATLFQVIPDFEAVGTVLDITAGALGIAQAATPTLNGSQPSQFDQTYAQIQQQIATIQQQTQDALTFHQSYVLGDYGLLSTVGHLVGSQIWTLDPEGALSLHRQAFTAWVYQAFLPALWDRWTVQPMGVGFGCNWDADRTFCVPPGSSAATWVPTPPDNGLGMVSWQPDSSVPTTSFDGLLPKQTPCSVDTSNPFETIVPCIFQDLTDHGYGDTLTYLRTTPPATCVYNPGQSAWEYGTCPLGVDLNDVVQWGFNHITCAYEGFVQGAPGCNDGSICEDQFSCLRQQSSPVALGEAQGVGTDKGRVDLTLQVPLEDDLDLRQARVTLGRLIREVGGAEELVSDPGGADVSPRTLTVRPGAKRHKATFKTPGREVPHIQGTLAIDNGQLTVEVHIDRATLDLPQRCDRTTFKTHLHTHLVIDDGQHRPAQVHSTAPWQCVTDRDGDVRRLQWSPEPASR